MKRYFWNAHSILAFVCAGLIGFSTLFGAISATNAAPQRRIVGGIESDPNAYPWMAGITDAGGSSPYCGGTLVAPKWVLTAAHCFLNSDETSVDTTKSVDVILGRFDMAGQAGEIIHVAEIIPHPSYYPSVSDDYDITLLKLVRPSNQPVIALAGSDFSYSLVADGTPAKAIGWGNTSSVSSEESIYPDKLREVDLPIVSNITCQASAAPMNVTITQNMVCAGYKEGKKDSCTGDSGGPLVIQGMQGWVQVGLTSFGYGINCADPDTYGVYTRIPRLADWIENTICNPSEPRQGPVLLVETNENQVDITASRITGATGYRLYFAPFPGAEDIFALDLGTSRTLSVELPSGTALYLAVQAYTYACSSPLSNVECFTIP